MAAQGQRQRIVLWAAVLGAAAAFAPAARGDDGSQPLPVAVPDATALVESALEITDPDELLAEVDSIAEVVEVAEEAADTTEQVPTEPVADVEPATPTAETAAPAPEAPATAADTAVSASDTPVPAQEPASDAAAAPAAAPALPVPTAVVQQVQPANVNVSIRIESPGDNGAVSQINAAIADAVANIATTAAQAAQYQPAESQYQATATPVAATQPAPEPSATESPTTTTSAPAPSSTEPWDWTWQWSCGEAISPEIVLPANSLLPIWNWNWNWNCGGSPSSGDNSQSQLSTQYQSTATQYQPMNVNIAIRFLSPGNDGPVTQTNVAQTNVAARIVNTTTQLVTQILHAAPGSSTTPGPPAGGSGAVPAPTAGGGIAGAIVDLAAAITGLPFEIAVQVVCCELVSPTAAFGGAHDRRPARPTKPRTLGSAAREMPLGPTVGEGGRGDANPSAALAAAAPVTPEAIAALAAPRPAVEAARRAQAEEQLKQRAAEKAAPIRDRATTLAYAGATPLGAPDRGFKLHFLFLLPFAFAFADAARRVVGDQQPAAADPGRPEGRPG